MVVYFEILYLFTCLKKKVLFAYLLALIQNTLWRNIFKSNVF